MNTGEGRRIRLAPLWLAVVVAILAIVVASAALTATILGNSSSAASPGGVMGGASAGIMGGAWPGSNSTAGPQPGEPGFVAGTVASPRLVRIVAGPGYAFSPSTLTVARGETITFRVSAMGPLIHEFMVGPAADVAADKPGTPEIADLGMMETKSVTYTFDGTGPYAFACHAPGHVEAGMRGSIVFD
jgi:uncharacterized cupredoxin-like copper-binding protein